ncbi:hypothetical protein T484DRAFT_2105653 [Baffinella frigidus]|nr:hypothetical protein T484DRAFT_2105653 [Cryptophyta sp. CCMP2293]
MSSLPWGGSHLGDPSQQCVHVSPLLTLLTRYSRFTYNFYYTLRPRKNDRPMSYPRQIWRG